MYSLRNAAHLIHCGRQLLAVGLIAKPAITSGREADMAHSLVHPHLTNLDNGHLRNLLQVILRT